MARRITPQDLYQIQQPTECRLSPDGQEIAVTVSRSDKETLKAQSHLWMVPARGGEPRQFTRGKDNETSPRFSPNGKTLAFLSTRSGKTEIWTIPTDGGEASQLTRLAGSVTDFVFSPNGKKIALTFVPQDEEAKDREEKKKRGLPGQETPKVRSFERIVFKLDGLGFMPKGRSHIWVVDAKTGRGKPITSDDRYDETQPVFSPDGKWIFFGSNRAEDPDIDFMREDIWRVPGKGGPIEKVRTFAGPSSSFSLSPDGRWIAFLGREDPDASWDLGHTKLWLAPTRGGRPVELTAHLDRSCRATTLSDTYGLGETKPPIWSPDSQWIHFLISNEGNTEVWRVHVRERRPVPVIARRGAVIDYDIDFGSGYVYAALSDPRSPGELYVFSVRESQVARHMTTWNAWLEKKTIAMPEEFWFRGKGRHRLQGWALPGRAAAGRRSGAKRPAVLYIHGGPGMQYGRVYFHEFQCLAARGYTVLYSNPRGGTGYGAKHLAAIHNNWGSVDYSDLMLFVDEALRRYPAIDRRRLGVAGGSYGGYMTNWIIGHTDRFAAAVTQRSISNLMSFSGSSDFGFAWSRVFGGRQAWQDPANYLRMSPISYADSVRTPTLIEHQENDQRCPVEQAEQWYAALKVRKVPVCLHRYPEESHGMSRGGRPDRRIERLERIADWFDRWLGARKRGR